VLEAADGMNPLVPLPQIEAAELKAVAERRPSSDQRTFPKCRRAGPAAAEAGFQVAEAPCLIATEISGNSLG